MRAFDHTGLLLAEYQGRLFEKSAGLRCSSPVFIRRFLHSELLKKLDRDNPATLSLDAEAGVESICAEFGESGYGREKYPPDVLFWMGYMYRYIAYTREQDTPFVMKLFGYRQLKDVYYSFHTQDPEWCVRSLLEINGLTEDVFDNNLRLKAIMRAGELETA